LRKALSGVLGSVRSEGEVEKVYFVPKTDFSFRAHLSYTHCFMQFFVLIPNMVFFFL
jgi:hypothetical protein